MEKSRNNNSRRLMAIIAVVLMVCLILAMGAVTFAKYITSGTTGDQTATAAKWGFVVNVDANKLLGKEYKGPGLAKIDGTGTVAVQASTDATQNILGPNTTGSVSFTISGTAEVLAQLKISIGAISGKDAVEEIHVGDYYPVKWTLKKGDTVVKVGEEELKDMKLGDINVKLGTGVLETINAGTSVESITYTLSWEWALEQGENDDAKATNNVKDTAIGWKAHGKAYSDIENALAGEKKFSDVFKSEPETVYNAIVATMSFNLTISVEQIQTTSD